MKEIENGNSTMGKAGLVHPPKSLATITEPDYLWCRFKRLTNCLNLSMRKF
jgi:hypothetical protein